MRQQPPARPVFLWAAAFACRDTTEAEICNSGNAGRQQRVRETRMSCLFAAVGAGAGLLQTGNGQVDKLKRLQRPRGRAQTLL